MKTPITYRWISESTLARKAPDQEGREPGEDEDPVRVDEAVAEVDELARQEPVPREQRREPREALVRGVGREHEDGQRECLDEVVDEPTPASRPGTSPRDLREHGGRRARPGVHLHRQPRDAEEEQIAIAPYVAASRRVLGLRTAEGGHAVRDRLHAGQRGRARGERLEQDEEGDAPAPARAGAARRVGGSPKQRLPMPTRAARTPR